MPLHSVRAQLPFTKQTDPNEFPAYDYAEYPKMLLRKCTKEDLEAWVEANKNVDEHGKVSYNAGRPRVGNPIPVLDDVNQPLVIHNREDEEDWRAANPGVELYEPPTAASTSGQVARLEKENEEMRAKLAALEGNGDAEPAPNKIAALAPAPARDDPGLPKPLGAKPASHKKK